MSFLLTIWQILYTSSFIRLCGDMSQLQKDGNADMYRSVTRSTTPIRICHKKKNFQVLENQLTFGLLKLKMIWWFSERTRGHYNINSSNDGWNCERRVGRAKSLSLESSILFDTDRTSICSRQQERKTTRKKAWKPQSTKMEGTKISSLY